MLQNNRLLKQISLPICHLKFDFLFAAEYISLERLSNAYQKAFWLALVSNQLRGLRWKVQSTFISKVMGSNLAPHNLVAQREQSKNQGATILVRFISQKKFGLKQIFLN